MHRTGREPPKARGQPDTLCPWTPVPVLTGPGCSHSTDSFGCLPQRCPQDPVLGEFQAMQRRDGRRWWAAAREIPGGGDQSFSLRARPVNPPLSYREHLST